MEHIREGKNLAMEIDYQFRLIVTYEHDLSLNATAAAHTYSKNHNYQVFNWPFQCSVLFSFAYFCSQRARVFLIEHLVERNPTKLNSNQEICASTNTHTKKI